MAAIQDTAETAIRNLFKKIANSESTRTISAIDYMDDGTPIALKIVINGEDGSATFDFTGTGPEVLGGCRKCIAHYSWKQY
jgi:5-oxoprolinase (ATP-hydrolysing)